MLISISLLWGICHAFAECRIPNKLTNTLYWITNPELVFFNNRFVILAEKFTLALYNFARPFRSGW